MPTHASIARFVVSLFTREVAKDMTVALASIGVGGATLKAFDKSSQEICACLTTIDNTLVDGFAGKDIETEKLNRALAEVGSALATAREKLDIAERNFNRPGAIKDFAVGSVKSAREDVDFLEQSHAQLEEKLAALGVDKAEVLVDDAATNPLSTSPLDPAAAAGQGLTELCDAFTAKLAELSAAIDALAGRSAAAMEGISTRVEATKGEALVAGAEVGEDAAGALESSLTRMDASAANAFASIAASGLGASAQLQQAFGALDDVIFGSLGKLGPLFSKLFGGGLGKILGSILGFAGGGAVQPGIPILVGERGPEVLIPSGPGRVLNAHDSGRLLGGGGQRQLVVNQTNTFSTDVKNTVRAEVMNALPLATHIAAEKVMNALRGIRY